MKPKLFNLRLLVSLCNLNYLQISVKEKWLNREKQLLIHLLQSSFCYVLNFTVVKSNPKISIIYHEIKISERYTEQVFYKKAVLKNFAIFTEKHLRWSLFLNKNAGLQSWNFIKKVFPVNIIKLLGTPVLKNICERLFERFPTWANNITSNIGIEEDIFSKTKQNKKNHSKVS